MFSPQDLKRPAFNKTLKGYVPAEVDEYIMFLLKKYKEVYDEYAVLEEKYKAALEKLDTAKSEESAITQTIVNAQKMADAIVGDAKAKANEIKSSVADGCDRVLEVYVNKVSEQRERLAESERLVMQFKDELFAAYKKHIALLDEIMPDEPATPYLSDDELVDKAIDLAKESLDPETLNELSGADTSDASDDSVGGDTATES